MKQSDLNHLRRLLGWVRCDIGQDPASQQQTMLDIAAKLGPAAIDADAKARLVEGYRRAETVPVYVRDAVKALEKALAAAGRSPGGAAPRATAETRADTGFDPGADAGREPVLDDAQIERGLAEIGVYVWGQRGEDWLAGAEYAARILRGCETAEEVKPIHTPAEPPTLRRDDTGGASEARLPAPAHEAQEVQVDHETAGPAESGRPAITLQVMQEALRLMPSDEARRVAREAEAVSSPVTPEQYVGAGAVEVISKLQAIAPVGYVAAAALAAGFDAPDSRADIFPTIEALMGYFPQAEPVAVHAFPLTVTEPLVRYCPGSGSIGPVESEYLGCCPDGGEARMVPAALAEKCRDTLKIAVKSLLADAAANDDAVVLPPLPKPVEQIGFLGGRPQDLFDIEGLQTYARAAVLADRQQRAGDAVAAEALAHLRTIADFGGTLDQTKELAARGIRRCAALATQEGEAC
ncbi:hypothetical protein [Achromobacter sp. 2789STDY5608628]|uniref:hypothetical protein n=1 Tax=Achromobacter sp. 2789STDY5608628 TaxID=1806493 RepID=UPI0006C38781|nr:hypothetical protein [Achromobacter sp. 2789STDY5608628]CUJ67946.1 Uncharacterised protein [Achromobacter sp. 2789STDY5608628]